MTIAVASPSRLKIVIIGAGFGGLSAAKAMRKAQADITLIDRQNHHLFQPLLYQVATAGLSPADIASPIRSILREQKNTTVMLADVRGIDVANRAVQLEGRRVPYDRLIVATGAGHAYFGRDDWAQFAPGLKTIDDATALRRKILLAFERAETETDLAERRRLQTFVVIGGGPTGVEMAGAIAELARKALAADFRNIDLRRTRVVLVEAGPRLLTPFDAALSEAARRALEMLGVDVRLGRPVTACDEAGVSFGDTRIETRTIMWAAGVTASPAGAWLCAEVDHAGRVKVEPDLSVPGQPDIFVIGDTASLAGVDGRPLPGVAPVAKQQGEYIGKSILARMKGQQVPPFRYRDFGSMATIGRKSAVVQFGKIRLHGTLAWFLWCFAHIYFLIGFRNRLAVTISWAWNYVTFQRGTRLITGFVGTNTRIVAEIAENPVNASSSTA
ncbi:MAG: NAD(P)/FAD-dependent oxidoreductase [Beijerinckiaceae bacterium]